MFKIYDTEDCTLYLENKTDGYMEGAFLHWEIYKWSPSKVKFYKTRWKEIIEVIRKNGIANVYAIAPSSFEQKLIEMFGFKYTGLVFHGYKLMRYE